MRKTFFLLPFSFFLAATAFAVTPTPTPTPTATPSPTPASVGQNFSIIWDDSSNPPSSKIVGYHIEYGSTPGTFTTTIDSPGVIPPGQKRTKDFTNFPLGTVYLALTAYNDAGLESVPTPAVQINVLGTPMPPGTPTITGMQTMGMMNVSTRAQVGTGNDVMIGGFVVGGPEKVVVRAIGPSLGQYGIEDPLSKASVELHDSTGATIQSNDGWESGGDVDELKQLKLAPSSPAESALIASLAPGSYTAIVRGAGTEVGVGLVEVYGVQ